MEFKKPKVEGKCDVCGADLIQRDDDKPEAIKRRLEQFHEQNDPIIRAYEQRGVLLTIDAKPSIEEISRAVERELLSV